ncbi:hypothetical protein Nepgr_023857 [Nepenthes gracilis]|uniref:Pectinesterase n=1 Tax=Nepenthes gracilis TaxID=150966 RepID=A0AAD3T3I3_NEPGR|nr:hypothetical protein Nepgr_023857 [Nepenthes gracilis]
MDTIKSFKGYGKVDVLEQQAFQKKTRRRLLLIIISCVVLLAVLIAAVVGTVIRNRRTDSSGDDGTPSSSTSPAQSLKMVCSFTQYPDACFSSISSLQKGSNGTDPEKIFVLSLQVALDALSKLAEIPASYSSRINGNAATKAALEDCSALFDDAIDRLNDTISSATNSGSIAKLISQTTVDDIKTWLSAAMTDQESCFDGLAEINGTAAIVEDIRGLAKNSTEFISNSLAIVTKLFSILSDLKIPIHRRLLESGNGGAWPEWMGVAERRLLQEAKTTPNVVVAADGSGDYKTIGEAIKAAPIKNTSRFVIYVKAGTYMENVAVDKKVWNVMIYGDGMTETVVSGSLNFIDGTPTFSTATFAAVGSGFIAKAIGFKNTAGAEKHQAVAFRSGSDKSVFYQCLFDGFQDTLYAHSNRQFYRECTITGTIDFIFGNAAVVFQGCKIQPRQPLASQFNTITAQGKVDKNQNTGISIQKCTIAALDALTAQTYLGRPWKPFSTTIVMQSSIGSFLNPNGWIEWLIGVEPASTIFYAEYSNTGPGSDVSKRVNWTGCHPAVTAAQASVYTVGSFIDGSSWLDDANVAYDSSL